MDDKKIKDITNTYDSQLHKSRFTWIKFCNGSEVFKNAFPENYSIGLKNLISRVEREELGIEKIEKNRR